MSKFTKIAAGLAVVPVLAFATPVFAESPGQLQSGSNTYVAKNLTQKTSYGATATANACEELQYSIELNNTQFGKLTNIVVKASLPSASAKTNVSNMTATPDLATAGTTGSVTVTLDSARTISYQAGSTQLFDGNGKLVKTLADGITSANGVNVGDLNGSTAEFVNFKAKVNCPEVVTPPVVTPPVVTPPVVTPPVVTPPTVLPNTGAGSVIALFGLTAVAAAAAHRFYTIRRAVRG